jgi:hypothetical protein
MVLGEPVFNGQGSNTKKGTCLGPKKVTGMDQLGDPAVLTSFGGSMAAVQPQLATRTPIPSGSIPLSASNGSIVELQQGDDHRQFWSWVSNYRFRMCC